ncbi:exopolysaccharide biosynthesis protein [Saccharomonospora sp. NPDC046836]|uniref:exopolysaccharide biosynthesis protein n=1 Tax=Saccharomonospora sp. NPDC046836 TaxID=3156921 RepID=UPI0033CE5978
MHDDPARLSLVGQVLRRRWRLLAVLAVVGALAGAGASLLFSPGYRASATVLLQGPRQDAELRTEAQVAVSTVVLDRVAAALGWNVTANALSDSVTADVAGGNVVRITGTAATPEQAQQLTDRVAEEYVQFSTQLISNTAGSAAQVAREQRESLRRQVADAARRIDELHQSATEGLTIDSVAVRTDLEALRTQLGQAMTRLDEADAAAGRANLVIMGPAPRPVSPASPTMTQLAAGGMLLFVVLGVLGHLVAARGDRRMRDESEIAAALATPILANVDLPDTASAHGHRLSRWLLGDAQWNQPRLASSGEAGRDIRLHRVVSRILAADPPPRRVLALVADDDPLAQEAATRLAANAVFEVVQYAVARPTVPDAAGGSAVLVVLTAGTRTAWELVGVTEAYTDAGQAILGAVVTYRSAPAGGSTAPVQQARKDNAMVSST